MNSSSLTKGARLCLLLPVFGVVILSSCSNAGKNSNRSPLVAESVGGPTLTEETIEELKKIADDPNSQLTGAASATEAPEEAPPTASASLPPSLAWANGPFDPRSIQPGDVFFEQSGAVLHKAASLADLSPQGEWDALLRSSGTTKKRIVPMTLSMNELVALRESVPEEVALPTRSVALDFHTETRAISSPQIESLFREALAPSDGEPNKISKSLTQVKSRIRAGEEFFVITSVTASPSMKATYPGAPIGRRDEDPILNAITLLYSHLDQLSTEKEENAIIISRDPEIYWEFTASSLILDGELLKVVDQKPEPSGSFFSERRRR